MGAYLDIINLTWGLNLEGLWRGGGGEVGQKFL